VIHLYSFASLYNWTGCGWINPVRSGEALGELRTASSFKDGGARRRTGAQAAIHLQDPRSPLGLQAPSTEKRRAAAEYTATGSRQRDLELPSFIKHQFRSKYRGSVKGSTGTPNHLAPVSRPKNLGHGWRVISARPAKKVLIVEDNQLNLKLLKDVLEYHGYVIFTTSQGEAALDIARQHNPDLILMDIQLPDISGFEATSRLKADERTRAIPIIAVTAFAMSGDRAKVLASGCDDYVAKRLNVTEFLQFVARYTDQNPG
jgi:two-component system cell cycle response regulator DivK